MEWEFLDRELCISTPKSLLNPPRTGSKTERHGVRKTLVEQLLRGFLLFKTSKMVTFGHHFENGGFKIGSNNCSRLLRTFDTFDAQAKRHFIAIIDYLKFNFLLLSLSYKIQINPLFVYLWD